MHKTTTLHRASNHRKNQAKYLFFDGRKLKVDGPIEKALNVMPVNEKDHMRKIFELHAI